MAKQVLLDTNFILSSARNKIDFFEELNSMGFNIIIPKQVLGEIEKIKNSKKKLRFKEDAKLSLKILSKNKFKKIYLKINYVDKGILKYIKEHPKTIVATLDSELKRKIKGNKVVIREKKRLEII